MIKLVQWINLEKQQIWIATSQLRYPSTTSSAGNSKLRCRTSLMKWAHSSRILLYTLTGHCCPSTCFHRTHLLELGIILFRRLRGLKLALQTETFVLRWFSLVGQRICLHYFQDSGFYITQPEDVSMKPWEEISTSAPRTELRISARLWGIFASSSSTDNSGASSALVACRDWHKLRDSSKVHITERWKLDFILDTVKVVSYPDLSRMQKSFIYKGLVSYSTTTSRTALCTAALKDEKATTSLGCVFPDVWAGRQ